MILEKWGILQGVDDGYGGIMYEPTMTGYICFVVVIAIMLIIAAFVIGKKNVGVSTKQLSVSAICVALAFVLSNIKIFQMPMGGSITLLSMLFIVLVGYWYGIGAGILTGVAYGLLQLIIDPYILTLPQLLVDYPLAFGALGLSGISYHLTKKDRTTENKENSINNKLNVLNAIGSFAGKYRLQIGYVAGVLGRFAFAFISGWIFFGEYATNNMSAPVYSFCYNGAYLGAEALLTLIIISIPATSKAIKTAGNLLNK